MTKPYQDGDFDLEGIGLTAEDLDFDDSDLPPLPLDRPRWKPTEHWETSEAEHHHHDIPFFASHAQRTGWFVREMARRALTSAGPGATEDDPIFPYNGALVSLRELLSSICEVGDPAFQIARCGGGRLT